MNKTAIRNYAIWARVQLIEAAKQRAYTYEISASGKNDPNAEIIGSKPITKEIREQRAQLIAEIAAKGFDQVMEEAAYTWFNRFIALRFMEVNGYLPTKVRVFTNENGEFKPEILKEAMTVELDIDRARVLDLLDKQDNEELFKMLIIAQCNVLSKGLPYMFETISNWTELLFPANLLKADSVIGQMVTTIPEDDWTDAVQIIGWLYQYYNSELKDETFALLKKNVKITKERIPAATQLFTPDWIVRYMVENSLGRLWVEGHPDDTLKSEWKYYLEEAEQEPAVQAQLAEIRKGYADMRPEDIKIIDPCMGSGHILVYAFDVLMQIYTSAGWSERDAARSIIENNIYGLDIDDRAGQLAYFAVMMKARKYNRRILNGSIVPSVMSIQDSSFMTDDFIKFVAGRDNKMQEDLKEIRLVFTNAKEYGSILNVPELGYDAIIDRIEELRNTEGSMLDMLDRDLTVNRLLPLVKQAQIMTQKYDTVITNPPYMGNANMSASLSGYVKQYYPDSKTDLCTVFIEKCMDLLNASGYAGLMTSYTWMFITSYKKFRASLLSKHSIDTLVQPEYHAFFESANVPICLFVLIKGISNFVGTYVKLSDFYGADFQREKLLEAVKTNKCPYVYSASRRLFEKIPDMPIAYWLSMNVARVFDETSLSNYADCRIGIQTGNNDLFVRLWQEVTFRHVFLEGNESAKWFPYTKGGCFRKWYGNNDLVINFENNGHEIAAYNGFNNINNSFYFQSGITWGLISSGMINFRYVDDRCHVFGNAGPVALLRNKENEFYILALLNSTVISYFSTLMNPTMNLSSGTVSNYPTIIDNGRKHQIESLSKQNIAICKEEWNLFETSWDFAHHPLLHIPYAGSKSMSLLSDCYVEWEKECNQRFFQLQQNEEELNRIFIDIYGLQAELTPEVKDKDVTVRKADLTRDIKSLISYAVGCMLGRYSLDTEGLAFAGGDWDSYVAKNGWTHGVDCAPLIGEGIFLPDADGILPITDDEYFTDDITNRFVEFIKTVYGSEALEENLKFIADALGGKGTAREVIRNYFLNDFYADHLKIYQKRPIYWLFDSGKKNGFKCLIYMHRYQPDTIARIRTDYIHELQSRYHTAIADLTERVDNAGGSERVKLNKQLQKIKDQELELQKYEEKIHHLADQMISIDLDDGVKVNYAKFQDVLAKIK